MNTRLLIITLLFVVSCSNESSPLPDRAHQQIQSSATQTPAIELLPSPIERNPFVFQESVSQPVITNPWQEWKLLGTFVVGAKARHALLSNPSGVSYVFSQQSELPEAGWSIVHIENQSITFAHVDGLLYSMRSKQP